MIYTIQRHKYFKGSISVFFQPLSVHGLKFVCLSAIFLVPAVVRPMQVAAESGGTSSPSVVKQIQEQENKPADSPTQTNKSEQQQNEKEEVKKEKKKVKKPKPPKVQLKKYYVQGVKLCLTQVPM